MPGWAFDEHECGERLMSRREGLPSQVLKGCGVRTGGAEAYEVRFAKGVTMWLISLSSDGKIATLLLQ